MKKFLLIISTALLPGIAFAQSTSTFSLPDDFTSNIWVQAQSILSALGPYVEMIIGVILAAVVLEIIIGSLKK